MIVLVIAAFMFTAFHGSNFSDHGFAPNGVHGIFTAVATSGIVFSYLGFRQGIELAGETDNPRRNVPLAVVGSAVPFVTLTILLGELRAVTVSYITLLLPFGALAFGAVVYGEPLTLAELAGAALVAAGIAVAQWPATLRPRMRG